jgi:hypothetical protein
MITNLALAMLEDIALMLNEGGVPTADMFVGDAAFPLEELRDLKLIKTELGEDADEDPVNQFVKIELTKRGRKLAKYIGLTLDIE